MRCDNKTVQYWNFNIIAFFQKLFFFIFRRAATIQADSIGQLWAMDRQTFRRILLKSAFRKRKMYESLLDSVPMLKTLQVNIFPYMLPTPILYRVLRVHLKAHSTVFRWHLHYYLIFKFVVIRYYNTELRKNESSRCTRTKNVQ